MRLPPPTSSGMTYAVNESSHINMPSRVAVTPSAGTGQLLRFLVVGCTTMAIDFSTYSTLLWAGLHIPVAKGSAVFVGTIAAYFLNRLWTFAGTDKHHRKAVWQFCVVYSLTLIVNVLVNELVLHLLGHAAGEQIKITAAFLVSTVVSAILNFLGMKLWVFGQTPNTK